MGSSTLVMQYVGEKEKGECGCARTGCWKSENKRAGDTSIRGQTWRAINRECGRVKKAILAERFISWVFCVG